MTALCSYGACLRPAHSHGMCKAHTDRARRGTLLTPEQKFWSKVDRRGPDDCWPWRRGLTDGYGYVRINSRAHRAHRIAWAYVNGPIPDTLELDHTCHNPQVCQLGSSCPHRRCCNPAHLRPVTGAENSGSDRSARDLITGTQQRAKTHCPAGHEYTPENTHLDRRGWRNCKACRRLSQAAGRQRRAGPLGG